MRHVMTVHDIVADARGRLGRAGIRDAEAQLDAEVLARQILGWDRARFLTGRHVEAPSGFRQAYEGLIARRERREPTSYIVGSREFWGLDFVVSSDVLIPRPETEILVEEALACVDALRSHEAAPLVVDAGTGSGCVAVALALERPDVRILATDISLVALQVARDNAIRHGVFGRIRFVRMDLLAALAGQADLVVSNPPYVPQAHAPGLMPEVREFEPHVALFGGATGMDQARALIAQAARHLAPHGRLLMEFGDGQEDDVRRAIAEWPSLEVIRVRHDLQGIPRMVVVGHREPGTQ